MMRNKLLENSFKAWNILPSAFLMLANRDISFAKAVMEKDVDTDYSDPETWREMFSPFVMGRSKTFIDDHGIAHISVSGTLFQNEAPYIVAAYGGTTYNELADDLKEAEEKSQGIFLSIDSPGGHAAGNAKISRLFSKAKVPAVAYVGDYCCSAAYSIASGCNYIYANDDSLVGSIGTVLPLLDVEGLWNSMGIKADYITNREGVLKTSGMPPNQTVQERHALQRETESYFELFKEHVLKFRDIPEDAITGEAFVGKNAKDKNLIDGICTQEKAYEKLFILTRK
jgi:Periplasmic serine proteases (ClpP class)